LKGSSPSDAMSDDLTGVETISVLDEHDLIRVRQTLREHARRIKMGLVEETKLITAGSELARNILKYAVPPGGTVVIRHVQNQGKKGIHASFEDHGPGIAKINEAMMDGFSTSGSLGLGLPGARRLVDEFQIESKVGSGTRVVVVKWTR